MDCVKKFKVSMFLKWILHDIYDGRGKKCYPCLECYNMYILVSTSYCAPTSRFIFIFLLSIDFLKNFIYICKNHIRTSKKHHLLLFGYLRPFVSSYIVTLKLFQIILKSFVICVKYMFINVLVVVHLAYFCVGNTGSLIIKARCYK